MTIDEAIKLCDEKVEELEGLITEDYISYVSQTFDCKENADNYKRLAEWLRELKKYRIAHYKLRDMDYEYDLNSKFGNNPMYYGEKVWDIFGDIDASVEYEVMGYGEVNADENSD